MFLVSSFLELTFLLLEFGPWIYFRGLFCFALNKKFLFENEIAGEFWPENSFSHCT